MFNVENEDKTTVNIRIVNLQLYRFFLFYSEILK